MKVRLFIMFLLVFFFSCKEKKNTNKNIILPEYRIGGFPMEYVTASHSEYASSLIENDDTIAVKYSLKYGGLFIRQFYLKTGDNFSKNWSCQLDEKLKESGSNILLSERFMETMNYFLETICKRNNLMLGDELKVANLFKEFNNHMPLIASYDSNWEECENEYFSFCHKDIIKSVRSRIDSCQLEEMEKAYGKANWIKKQTKNIEYFFTQSRCENLSNKDLVLKPKLYYRMRFEYENKIIVPKLSLMNPLALF